MSSWASIRSRRALISKARPCPILCAFTAELECMPAISLATPLPTVASGCRNSWRKISLSRSASARPSRLLISCLFRAGRGLVAQASCLWGQRASCPLILAVRSQAGFPAYRQTGWLCNNGGLWLNPPPVGSLKFTHFSATTSGGKKQHGIPAAGRGS